MLFQIKAIKEAITTIPIIANGNIITYEDVVSNLEFTGCDGVMSAEGILDDPALFHASKPTVGGLDSTSNITPSKSMLALEYICLCEKYPVTIKSIVFHIRRIIRIELEKYQLLGDLLDSTNETDIKRIILNVIEYEKNPDSFHFDSIKNKQMKEMWERKKREEGKRKEYEARMVRKAKREGKELNYYLLRGSENPTQEEVVTLKAMSQEKSFAIWKEKHSQHCYEFHFGANGCHRERTCSFLHADVKLSEAIAYG